MFDEETMHILDYECEFDKGYKNAEKFPEYNNRVFNKHISRFGDSSILILQWLLAISRWGMLSLEQLWPWKYWNYFNSSQFKTMPIPGPFRYQVGEPFYFYDLRAEITHDGTFKEVVIVDEKETLKQKRPFLFLLWWNKL